jgi:hypothetical protein
MELDFTKLNSIAFMDFSDTMPEKQPLKTLTETLLEPKKYKTTSNKENALQGLTEGLKGIEILQRQADANKEEKERVIEVYREYQENIKLSGQLQTDILKGVNRGENIYSLFLKAIQAISLMTSNTVFYSQINNDIRAIYGAGLSEKKTLEMELREVQKRLQRLKEARQRNTEPADSLQRIEKAIQAHEEKIADIESLIKRERITA